MRKYQLSCWSSALLSLVIIVGICDGKGVPIYSRSGSRKYINCEKKNRSKSHENVNKKERMHPHQVALNYSLLCSLNSYELPSF